MRILAFLAGCVHCIFSITISLSLAFFSPTFTKSPWETKAMVTWIQEKQGIVKELLRINYWRHKADAFSHLAQLRQLNMELLFFFSITFWRRAVFCITFASMEFCNSEILTSLKYLLIQQRWLLFFVAGRDSFKPQPPDVPGTVVCLELSWGGRRENVML